VCGCVCVCVSVCLCLSVIEGVTRPPSVILAAAIPWTQRPRGPSDQASEPQEAAQGGRTPWDGATRRPACCRSKTATARRRPPHRPCAQPRCPHCPGCILEEERTRCYLVGGCAQVPMAPGGVRPPTAAASRRRGHMVRGNGEWLLATEKRLGPHAQDSNFLKHVERLIRFSVYSSRTALLRRDALAVRVVFDVLSLPIVFGRVLPMAHGDAGVLRREAPSLSRHGRR